MFGEGDGRLATVDALIHRLSFWRNELGAGTIHWRMPRTRVPTYFQAARSRQHWITKCCDLDWDDFSVVPARAHEAGLKAYLYVSLFDEGWPLASPRIRAKSYHNAMHGRDVAQQSIFSRTHPEFIVVDQAGRTRQHGVLCLAYPEVRAHLKKRFLDAISSTQFDGLFICFRSQSKPARFADQYGFNDPVCRKFYELYGQDPRKEPFSLIEQWRSLLGDYITQFLSEISSVLHEDGRRLAVGVARGDILGPPLGNTELQWSTWITDGLIDELIVNQNSSQCPSMWHQLWPMHRGVGYIQNYLDGSDLPLLGDQLEQIYAPVMRESVARLFVAQQWESRSADKEAKLLAKPVVSGLVFSSFRFDNPEAIKRNNWYA